MNDPASPRKPQKRAEKEDTLRLRQVIGAEGPEAEKRLKKLLRLLIDIGNREASNDGSEPDTDKRPYSPRIARKAG